MTPKHIAKNLLHLNHLRKFLGWEIFGAAIKSEFKFELLDKPSGRKALVLSPHPDDDIFGCGGTLKLHTKANDSVKVVYLADGSGDKNSDPKKRRQEARRAASILGVEDLDFWNIPDGHLSYGRTETEKLSNLLSSFKPDLIYVPSFLDPHPDHFGTASILASTLRQMAKGESANDELTILSYEIWTPIFANRLVKIDPVIESKKEAMASHASQQGSRSYFDAILGLNQYRAGMFNHGKYAEAFFECNRELYLKLFKLVEGKQTAVN